MESASGSKRDIVFKAIAFIGDALLEGFDHFVNLAAVKQIEASHILQRNACRAADKPAKIGASLFPRREIGLHLAPEHPDIARGGLFGRPHGAQAAVDLARVRIAQKARGGHAGHIVVRRTMTSL